MTAVVELDHATIRIGGRSVLADANFAIQAGEFIGVLGPNGAGKTTLMRSILGLLPPSAGRVRVFGRTPECGDRTIGYLPQLRTVLPDLRVRGLDFIGASLNGERWGVPRLSHKDRHMIEETLDAVGARELATRPLSQMSGGERQRLLLAQALIGSPKLLLLDEPLISLDARHQEVAIEVVRRVCRERGITVLFSAHELNQLFGGHRPRALSRQWPGRSGHGRRGRDRAGAVAALRHRDRGDPRQWAYLRHVARQRRRTRRPSCTSTADTTTDIITDMFQYEFMTNAFAAAGIVAVVSGVVGFFLVMRGQTFAGHALSHIGFAGATGAGLIGLAPLWGLLGFTLAAGIVMGALSDRISNRDVAIGVVLALALGFGLLFLHYYTSFATQATALLFGNVLAVDHGMIATLALLGAITLVALAAIMRPLDFRDAAAGTGRGQRRADTLSSRPPFWRSWRWRYRNARRSSACCWCSR